MVDVRKDNSSDLRTAERPHIPVLLNQVIESLSPADGDIIVDGTFGAGGYSRALLESTQCVVVAIDRDPFAIKQGQAMQDEFGDRLKLVQGCFGDMENILDNLGLAHVNGITLDLGVSSMQLDNAERGFSFMRDGPLDMRMAHEGVSAEDIVNELSEDELARIIAVYGEEKKARAIARAIARRRENTPITRTGELADIVESVLGAARYVRGEKRTHPATRTFQALRIYVNDELGELLRALKASEAKLAPHGRLAIVTFHSLEDRIVKKFFSYRTGRVGRGSRHMPEQVMTASSFAELRQRRQDPTADEISDNPRARSARLRAVERTQAPIMTGGDDLLPRLQAPHQANRVASDKKPKNKNRGGA